MPPSDPSPEKLKLEAHAWAMRLTSGTATEAEIRAFERWRAASHAHREAFADAKFLWHHAGPAAEAASRRMPREFGRKSARQSTGSRRRVLLSSAGFAMAAVALAGAERPPLGLWPSLAELTAKYRTVKGEQREIALNAGSVELNTQTSIDLHAAADGTERIELISGEAAVKMSAATPQQLLIIAGPVQAATDRADFNVQYINCIGYITCIDGQVRVTHKGTGLTLKPATQISYDANGLRDLREVDPAVVLAWQQGLLIFRDVPLAAAIQEINRYRPGRVILLNEQLGRESVYGNFRIDRIDRAIPEIQAILGFHVTDFPTGVTLIS